MATLILPVPTIFDFGRDMRVLLDGAFYQMRFIWNDRNTSWAMTLSSGSNEAIVRNIRMVVAQDILLPYKALEVPQGRLNVVDTSGLGLDPAERTDFGDRVQLQYVEVDAT